MPQTTLLARAALAQMCSVHEIEEFLRGPQQTMWFGTSGLPMARQFASTLQLA
ncbi:hypothetical protein DIPPA_00402 [Diplonema papillatum]|nr:hypothetical protein DIPPA_00402 [Diplonema papillatum]